MLRRREIGESIEEILVSRDELCNFSVLVATKTLAGFIAVVTVAAVADIALNSAGVILIPSENVLFALHAPASSANADAFA
jgi:hypothetical protein